GQLPMRLEEHLLQQVLGVLPGAEHAHHEAEKAPGMLAIQLLERVGIPCPAPRGQLEVGGSHVSWLVRRRRAGPELSRNGSCFTWRLRRELDGNVPPQGSRTGNQGSWTEGQGRGAGNRRPRHG